MGKLAVLLLYVTAPWLARSQNLGEVQYPYQWVSLDYDWPSDADRDVAVRNETYKVENNVIAGIKVHAGQVYVTVPRWLTGVPSTMNKVVQKNGAHVLQPYPSWEMQEIDDCNAFQFTQSMEIVPETNEMWVIDVGRRNIWNETEVTTNCPPKLVIINMNTGAVVKRYTFPDSSLSHTKNFVNDIVVDPERNFAYMTDSGEGAGGHKGGIVVYDRNNDRSHRLEHSSMRTEPDALNITINGEVFVNDVPSDGIALSPDKDQLYYCALGAFSLWQMPTSVARSPPGNLDAEVRSLGHKRSQSDGLLMGHENLYFGALSLNAAYKWQYTRDMMSQNATLEAVNMTTQTQLVQDNVRMRWADTFALADDGWMWITANQLPLFKERRLNFGGTVPNFYIAKVYVNDKSYLMPEVGPTTDPNIAVDNAHSTCLIITLLMGVLLHDLTSRKKLT